MMTFTVFVKFYQPFFYNAKVAELSSGIGRGVLRGLEHPPLLLA